MKNDINHPNISIKIIGSWYASQKFQVIKKQCVEKKVLGHIIQRVCSKYLFYDGSCILYIRETRVRSCLIAFNSPSLGKAG